MNLAKALDCVWIKGEMAHSAATFGARAQAGRGLDYGKVFGRIWSSKMQRLGFLASCSEPEVVNEPADEALEGGELSGMQQQQGAAVISLYHMRKPARDAIRDALLVRSVKPVFVIMHITEETLSGRTLGAEEPQLAEKIMAHKIADIQEPLEEERDVVLVDSLRDVDALFQEILEAVTRKLQDGE